MTNNTFRALPAGGGLVVGCVLGLMLWAAVAVMIVLMWMTWCVR